MANFIRIGGEIVSSPLNENFRRLLNQISLANTNLIFPEENGTVATYTDMYDITDPDEGQVCYVVSSGQLYRYSKHGDGSWILIADFGETFRQGFLNSGVVVMADDISLKDSSTLTVPDMLIYFKNQPGDNNYLKGMYKVEETDVDISNLLSQSGIYSLFVNTNLEILPTTGMPDHDDVNLIYIGTFLIHDGELNEDFIYTIPDVAYTADRGLFYMDGGKASGMNLEASQEGGNALIRAMGYYYDEGINYSKDPIENYPTNVDNSSNYNLKQFEGEDVEKIYYAYPQNAASHDIDVTEGTLIINKWYNPTTDTLNNVPQDNFTIQQHFVTPNGINIILYGNEVYNSMSDALTHINDAFGSSLNIPHVEATRIIVGNVSNFDVRDMLSCRFFVLDRLAQVGTPVPEFADTEFKIYSNDPSDVTPSVLQFSLNNLQTSSPQFNGIYTLYPLSNIATQYLFGMNKKYIKDDTIENVTMSQSKTRTYGTNGYQIADQADITDMLSRLNAIEAEIWAIYDNTSALYEQSLRYRVYHLEDRTNWLEGNKVNKSTTINGYRLGDNTTINEAKQIRLVTGDIAEGQGGGTGTNLYYTEARVSANTDVTAARTHVNTVSANNTATSHTRVNPHNISTDDLNILSGSLRLFVDSTQISKINNLPANTNSALSTINNTLDTHTNQITNLSNNKIENVAIDTQTGATITNLGNVTGFRFLTTGANVTLDSGGTTAIIDCIGHPDASTMAKSDYAVQSQEYPSLYAGYVDNAISALAADNIKGPNGAYSPNKYYGTDGNSNPGFYDTAVYVSTATASDFTQQDQIIFTPMANSVTETMLVTSLADKINNNYHQVYESGTLKSSEINTFKFGNNLSVTVNGHSATINATGSGSGSVTNFVNLNDVNVTYTGNAGKMLVVNSDANGIELSSAPSLDNYMLKSVYVDPNNVAKVKLAKLADTATTATLADNASAVNSKTVDDTKTTTGYLWTANKIISYVGGQIDTVVDTYSGTTVPSNNLGKDGDLYILLEN